MPQEKIGFAKLDCHFFVLMIENKVLSVAKFNAYSKYSVVSNSVRRLNVFPQICKTLTGFHHSSIFYKKIF